jgi:hypothetical protein
MKTAIPTAQAMSFRCPQRSQNEQASANKEEHEKFSRHEIVEPEPAIGNERDHGKQNRRNDREPYQHCSYNRKDFGETVFLFHKTQPPLDCRGW